MGPMIASYESAHVALAVANRKRTGVVLNRPRASKISTIVRTVILLAC